MEIVRYQADKKNIWDEFIDNSKNGTFMLKRDYMDYHSDRFEDFSLMFYEEDKLLAVLPASIKEQKICSHGGLTYGGIISSNSIKQSRMLELFSLLLDFLKINNIKEFVYKAIPYIYHNQPSDEDLYALFVNNANLFRRDVSSVINLTDPLKIAKGRKAQISRAAREGVIIKESDDFDTFIELENAVLKERHNAQAVHTSDELKLLKSRFNDEIKLFFAEYEGKPIAASVIFVYKKLIHTQYLAANQKAREIGALDLLIKKLIDNYSETKLYFDFGISTENGGRYLNDGLIAQKEGFGARAVTYDFYRFII